jgi:hypothetical protein
MSEPNNESSDIDDQELLEHVLNLSIQSFKEEEHQQNQRGKEICHIFSIKATYLNTPN